MYLTEAEDIFKKWQENTKLCKKKKNVNDLDNHDGVITDLEPDILECEVKQALGNITMSKASRGDGNPAELFQIQKDDAVEVLHAICQFSNLKNSAVATVVEKVFSLQSPQKSMPKNIQATTQLHSSHTLAK